MQLDRLTAVLRPRNGWEAIDLGFQMARRRYLVLWLLWWLSALPVTLLASLLLYKHPSYVSSAVWWFKPLFEPVLVFWLSRALFGERLSFRQARAQWWQATRHRLLGNLTWRRFSPNRSLFMPIGLLEQPDRKAWGQRTRVFTRRESAGTWLTLVGMHVEMAIALGLVFGLVGLIPEGLLPDWDWRQWTGETNTLMAWVWNLSSLFAMSLFAPFYVAGGFGLYLSQRTNLEAWDVELTFRRLAKSLAMGLLAASFVALSVVLPSTPAVAADTRERSAQVIQEVLQSDDFGKEEQVERWVLSSSSDEESPEPGNLRLHWLEGLAGVLEILAWTLVAALGAWLLIKLYRYVQDRQLTAGPGLTRPISREAAIRFVEMADPASLPPDIAAAARTLLGESRLREAISLLYRGSLAALVYGHALDLEASATEGECVELVSQHRPPEESDFFRQLTRHWVRTAYAGLPPDNDTANALLDRWQQFYSPARRVDA